MRPSKFGGTKKEFAGLQARLKAEQAKEKLKAEIERMPELADAASPSVDELGKALDTIWGRTCDIHNTQETCTDDPLCDWKGGILGFGAKCQKKDFKERWTSYTQLFCDPTLLDKEAYKSELIYIFQEFGIRPRDIPRPQQAKQPYTEWGEISKAQLCRFFGNVNRNLDTFLAMNPKERAKKLGLPYEAYEQASEIAKDAAKKGWSFYDIVDAVSRFVSSLRDIAFGTSWMKMMIVLIVVADVAHFMTEPTGFSALVAPGAVDAPPIYGPPALGELLGGRSVDPFSRQTAASSRAALKQVIKTKASEKADVDATLSLVETIQDELGKISG